MRGRLGEIPFVALTLCLVAGICISLPITQYSFGSLATGTMALVAGAGLALLRERPALALTLGLVAITAAGLMLALLRRDAYPEMDLRTLLAQGGVVLNELLPFDGCVADEKQQQEGESTVTLDLRALKTKDRWIPCRGRGILRIPDGPAGSSVDPTAQLDQGDRIRGWAAWHTPRNYQNPGASDHVGFLRRRGVFLQGRMKSTRLLEVIPGDCLDPWTAIALAARKRVRRNLLALAGNERESQAAILAALVIGDYSALSTPVREVFQNSGTYHVLVVSGLHVAWIAWVLIGLFRLLRLPQNVGRMTAALSIFFYTSVVGFQASVSRSLWTFLLYLVGQALFRRAPPANIALVSAFLLLCVRPDWIFDAGFQLSFLSVLAICITGAPIIERIVKPAFGPASHSGDMERLFLWPGRIHRIGRIARTRCELMAEAAGDRWHPTWERVLLVLSKTAAKASCMVASMLTISVSVQLWLEPLLAYHFNRLSWIAPAANLVVVPLSSFTLAAGLLSAIAADLQWIAPMIRTVSGWLSTLLLKTASVISGLPGAWQRCPTPALEWVLAGILLVFAWCFMDWRRKWIPWLFVMSVLLCLSLGLRLHDLLPHGSAAAPARGDSSAMSPDAVLSLTFLDVGEGDSLVLRFPGSRIWVLDAGGVRQGHSGTESDQGFDVGEMVVSRYLWSQWITRLDCLVLSHIDTDHAGGMPAVLKNFKAGRLEYGEARDDPLLARIQTVAHERRIPMVQVQAGDSAVVAGVAVDVINPPGNVKMSSTNEGSVVLRVIYGQFSALLTGDLEKAAEREVLARWHDLRSPLLKVAHHGSRWATMDAFLERVQPRWAVISVGRNNPFGHPSREVMERLLRRGVTPMLTLDQGAVTFATDGVRYTLSSHVCGVLQSGILQ